MEQRCFIHFYIHFHGSISTYTSYVAIMPKGKVVGASCSCVAGKGGACSHVAALMFNFEDLIKKCTKVLPNDGTVTNRLQQWHVPPKRVITTQPLENIQFEKAQYGKTTCRSSRRSHPYNHEADMPAVQSLVTNVLLACPSSGVSHFWTVATETVATSVSSSSEESPLDVIAPLIVYKDPTVLPSSVHKLANVDCSIDNTYFKEICQQYVDNQTISTELSQYIESHTRDQIKSILWLTLYNGRITSSQFGSICHHQSTTDNTNIIRQLMGYQKMVGIPRQIRWGTEKESEARQCATS